MAKSKLVEGLYDLVVDRQLNAGLAELPDEMIRWFEEPDAALLASLLTSQLIPMLRRAFRHAGKDEPEEAVALANELIALLAERLPASGVESVDEFVRPPKRLIALQNPNPSLAATTSPSRPSIPLTLSELLVNGRQDLRIGSELRKELESADRVDLLCAFLKFSGITYIREALERFLARRPGGLRILTTTYMGATENRAVQELLDMGADLRISYNNQTTRLHAKAWLFHRDTGFSTCFVGSSNLSVSALLDGLEWNVRVSAVDNPSILARFATTFEQYWNDVEFEPYDAERFKSAFQEQSGRTGAEYISGLKVRPFPHQSEILDDLAAEREAGHTRNLVVAATGTGKTVTAALDFKRLWDEHGPLKLLFVAHREEILKQSRATFRAVMGDPAFGELLTGSVKPNFGDHVFANVQSLHERQLATMEPGAYDVVIVDEFHHAAAPTYERLLNHVTPRYLLGLTATPERADGKSILEWFDHRIAAELRLWKALDRGLLAPFQYFGIGDETDLSSVTFRRGGYDQDELENVLTGDKFRALRIRQAVDRYVAEPHQMRAIGFCVGLKHAAVMAQAFRTAGLAACAVAGNPPRENGRIAEPFMDRDVALNDLRDGKLQVVFAVDLFNEGVDVPAIDTVLFLRPTESATVFLQQLGRGLRHANGKSHLTVLDFIGNANRKYRFDIKFKALTGGTRRDVLRQIEDDFPHLPPGCEIKLDRQAQDHVLENVKSAVGTAELRFLTSELEDIARKHGPNVSLRTYLDEAQIELAELYSTSGRSWTDLRRRANLPGPAAGDEYEKALLRAMSRVQHINDRTRIATWLQWLAGDAPPKPARSAPSRSMTLVTPPSRSAPTRPTPSPRSWPPTASSETETSPPLAKASTGTTPPEPTSSSSRSTSRTTSTPPRPSTPTTPSPRASSTGSPNTPPANPPPLANATSATRLIPTSSSSSASTRRSAASPNPTCALARPDTFATSPNAPCKSSGPSNAPCPHGSTRKPKPQRADTRRSLTGRLGSAPTSPRSFSCRSASPSLASFELTILGESPWPHCLTTSKPSPCPCPAPNAPSSRGNSLLASTRKKTRPPRRGRTKLAGASMTIAKDERKRTTANRSSLTSGNAWSREAAVPRRGKVRIDCRLRVADESSTVRCDLPFAWRSPRPSC